MKFYSKNIYSKILIDNLTYKENSYQNNKRIETLLLEEQYNFCAYTEVFIKGIDSIAVEHFNATLKYNNDNYYNYYTVIKKANDLKKDEKYKEKAKDNLSFFGTLFFQNKSDLIKRIRYVKNEYIFEETDLNDEEAREFIDFLDLNNEKLRNDRKNHMNVLKTILDKLPNNESKLDYFRTNKTQLTFITTIENEFNIDLSEFYTKKEQL